MTSGSRRFGPALWVLGYLAILIPVAGPLLRAPSELLPLGGVLPGWLPGDGDPWNFVWRIDWLWHHPGAILDGAPRTADFFHPFGVELTMVRGLALQGLLALGLRPAGDPFLAHNIIWALSFLLTAQATALLARAVSGSDPGAFAAGTLVAFGPPFYLHSLQHSYKYLAFALVPLALLALWRYLENGRPRSLALLAAAAAGILVSDWYNALYVSVAAAVVVAARARATPGHVLARRIGALALLTVPLTGVLLWSLAPVLSSRASTLTADLEEQARFSVDLVNLVLPPTTHAVWGWIASPRWAGLSGNEAEKTAFLGWVLPLVLGVLAWRRRRDPGLRTWSLMAALFFVLALGPWLQWDGHQLLRLPGYWLGQVPGLAGSRAPGRFVLMAHLAVAVSMAVLIAGRARPVRAAGLCLLIMAIEFAPFATPVAAVSRPPTLAALAEESEGVVLDVPYRSHSGLYTALQTQHRRPLVGGYLIRITRGYAMYLRELPGFRLFRDPIGASLPSHPEPLHAALSRVLGVRWVVLHKALLTDGEAAVARLEGAGLPLERWLEDEDTIVWRLTEAPPPTLDSEWWARSPESTSAVVHLGWEDGLQVALDPPPGAGAVDLTVRSRRVRASGELPELLVTAHDLSFAQTMPPDWHQVEVPVPPNPTSPWVVSLDIRGPRRSAGPEPPDDPNGRSIGLRRVRWR